MADWFRTWHGAPRDTKLALAAKKAGVPRAVAVAVWWYVLDLASQDEDRGSVARADPELIAFDLDCSEAEVAAVLSAFVERGMIARDRIVAWEKRQPKREDGAAAQRMQRWRARSNAAAEQEPDATDDASRGVTERDVTQRYAPEADTETEKKAQQTGAGARGGRAVEVGRRCLELLGWQDDPSKTAAPVHQWLADGCDPERDVYPTIERIVASGRRPGSLAYFTRAVTEAMRNRTAASEPSPSTADIEWRMRLKAYVASGVWPFDAGPLPGDPRTRVPSALLAEFADQLAGRAA